MFRRAGVPKLEVADFFNTLGVDFDSNKINQYIKIGYSTLGRVCGLKKLTENWISAGATDKDLQAVYNYFTVSDDIFYPYQPVYNDVDLKLPEGWEVIPDKDDTIIFKVKKDNVCVSFDVRDYLWVECDGNKPVHIDNDKRTLAKSLENYHITKLEVQDLEYSKKNI